MFRTFTGGGVNGTHSSKQTASYSDWHNLGSTSCSRYLQRRGHYLQRVFYRANRANTNAHDFDKHGHGTFLNIDIQRDTHGLYHSHIQRQFKQPATYGEVGGYRGIAAVVA